MSDSRIWKKAVSGIHEDSHAPRAAGAAFAVLALVLALVPLVGMAWARTDTTTENRELADFPSLTGEDGSFNYGFLPELGAYFEDHFAYRNEAVTANARLRALAGTSATDQVVIGTDGWLYYGGTLPDYLGQGRLSDRALASIAHNLGLAQQYVESHDAAFAFTLAPNKNSLDASHMPYYYLRADGASNAERLKPFLEAAGVNYVDLFDVLGRERAESGFGYLKLDSHWNNRWALIAANELLAATGRDALPVDPGSGVVRKDFAGDLQSMLYPSAEQLEDNYYYEGYNAAGGTEARWGYVEGSDVTESMVRTRAAAAADVVEGSGNAEGGAGTEGASDLPGASGKAGSAGARGNLLMFRDSFGNALLPFMASAFDGATFSKLVPYNLPSLSNAEADAVVIERAERHLSDLATSPAIAPAPAVRYENGLPPGAVELATTSLECAREGSYWVVRATVEGDLDPADRLYLSAQPAGPAEASGSAATLYDPFWTSTPDGSGILAYLPASAIDASSSTLRVLSLR